METPDIKIYCIYYDEQQIVDYNLKESNIFKFFNTTSKLKNDNINYLSKYFCELSAYYYIWKNNIKSDYIGFCHYRRNFNVIDYEHLSNGGIQCFRLDDGNGRYENLMLREYLFEKYNITTDLYQVSYNHMYIMPWDVFVDLCECVFGFYEWIKDNHGLDYKNADDIVPIYDLVNGNKVVTIWPSFFAVFNEFFIAYYLSVKYADKLICYKNLPIIIYNINDKEKLFNIYKKNLKTGCKRIYNISNKLNVTPEEIEQHHIYNITNYDNINDYLDLDALLINFYDEDCNTVICDLKNVNNNVIMLKDNEYIECEEYSNFKNIIIKTIDE